MIFKKDTSIENGRLLIRQGLGIDARLPSYNSLLAFLDNYATDLETFFRDYSPNYSFDDEPIFDLIDEPDLYDVVYLKSDGKYYKALVNDGATTENIVGIRHITAGLSHIIYMHGFVPMGTGSSAGTLGYLAESEGVMPGDPIYVSATTAGKLSNEETDIKLGYYIGRDSDSNYILQVTLDSGYIRPNSYDELTNKIMDGDLNLLKNFDAQRSLSFNGTTSMISFADNANLNFGTADFTVLLRFRTSADYASGSKPIVAKGVGTERFEFVMTDTNTLQFQIQDDAAELTIDSDLALNDGVAHTVIILGDRSGNYSMIVDGILQADTVTATTVTVTNAESLYLGRNEGGTDFFTGEIIDVRFFDRLLTDLEAKSWSRNPFKESATTDETFVVTSESFAVNKLYDLTTNGNDSSAVTDVSLIKPETPVNMTFKDESYIFSSRVGIGSDVLGNDIAGSTSDITGNLLHLKDDTGNASIIVEGTTGAYVNLVDLGGAADDKWLQVMTSAGITKMSSLNDDGTTLKDNILTIDHGNGFVGIKTAAASVLTPLHVTGSATLQGATVELFLQDTDGTTAEMSNSIKITTNRFGIGSVDDAFGTYAEKFTILNASGNTGIGNINPEEIFHVEENQNAGSDIRLSNTDAGNAAIIGVMLETDESTGASTIRQYGSGHATMASYLEMGTQVSGHVRLISNATQAILVDTTQNVLLGTGSAITPVSTEWRSGKLFEISHTSGAEIPMISLSSLQTMDDYELGALNFVNTDNAGTAGVGSQVVSSLVTSIDSLSSNVANDSGGVMEFWTKPAAGTIAMNMTLDGAGELTVVGDVISNGTNLETHATTTGTIGNDSPLIHGATSDNDVNMIVRRDASGDFACNIMTGTATIAQYSDLAENYTVEGDWMPGMIVSRNFTKGPELKITMDELAPDVFGIISTSPAYSMNSGSEGAAITMVGRIPVLIEGPVSKWDLIVPAGNGHGRRMDSEDETVFVIAEALESNQSDGLKLIECFAKVITKS